MDNDRLIAQISQREDATVEKVASRKIKSSPMITRMQRADELRKKTVKVEGLNKSRFCKLKIQENFDLIQNALQFEYGENMEIFLKSNEFEILSRWVEGVTLHDANKKEQPQKITEITRFRNRLRLWVRIFENLSYYHSKGIIHGNLKPQNILIRDRATVDIKQTYESEFFERKEEVPHIVLLDGGYFHFIPHHNGYENSEERISQSRKTVERNFWLSPEARGFIEGSYRENSDTFSLAAIMAWDLGMIKIEGQTILNCIWPLFMVPEPNTFILGGEWHKWTARHPIFETMKRLRTILLKALDPLPEKRLANAREIAFEFMMMSNKLADSLENQNFSSSYSIFQPEINEKTFSSILNKHFEIPEVLTEFTFDKNKSENNRFWIDARTNSANKHYLMRSLNLGLSIINKNSFYYGVKFSSMKVPFSTLDNLCQNLLNYTIFLNPLFLQEMKSLFFNLGNQVESIFYILPSLKKYGENKNITKKNIQNSLIQVRHEWLYNNIEKIFDKILSASKISFIIIDDINRSDHSSLPMLINIFNKHSNSIKWIIGIRSEEEISDEEVKKALHQMKHQDPSYSNLKDDRTRSHWVTKLNNLSSQQARFLSTWAMVDLQINTDIIELLSTKVMNIHEIFSNKYHEGKEELSIPNSIPDDLINEEEKVIEQTQVPSEEDEEDGKKKKDPLHLAYEALNIAIKIGLVSENRDILSGHLICYYWEHQFIWLSLSLLLNKEIKSKIYFILSEYMCNNIGDKTTLSEIIHISEYLSRSNLKKCAYSAYSSLIIATEELCDNTSTEFIISKLQMLSENIEKECTEEAPVLVPKIREHIADLSLSLGKFDQAEKYYQAVSWNTLNQKRKTILSMKSFFPSQIKKRERRTDEFLKLIHSGEKSGLLTNLNYDLKSSFKNTIESEIYKIQKKLLEQDSFSSVEESKNIRSLLKSIINSDENSNLEKGEKLQFFPKIKPVRGSVISRFLRACIGWIDNNILFPQILNVVHFTIENNDGESTIHLLFSLLLCGERNIAPKTRSLILETILDLSSRVGNDLSIFEGYLLKAWCSLFYDGNLIECKKNIDKINSSISGELPSSLKQCTRKLQIFIEFETLSFDAIKNHEYNIPKYIKKMRDYNISDWGIGNVIFAIQQAQPHLKKSPGDELFIGNILDEKTDQILLFTHLLFEKGHAHAASIISQEAKENQIRQWFLDPSSHFEYVPEKFAQKIIEYTNLKNSVFGTSKIVKNYKFVNSIKNFSKVFGKKKDLTLKYWGEDKAIQQNIRIDKANTQDSEKLHFLSQNAIRAGFHWTAYRLAHKSRSDLNSILGEIREIENSFKQGDSKESLPLISENISPMQRQTESRFKDYESSGSYPEQGVAINYVLEFLHNFQNNIQNSELSDEERLLLSSMIKKSVPKDSDIIESTLAGALRASAKRMVFKGNININPPALEENQASLEEEIKVQNEPTELKRTG
jgi:serine/threonine protein kinase